MKKSSLSLSKLSDKPFLSAINTTSLKTEVGILESPSVLFPVYEFVKDKKLKGSNNKEFSEFSDWKKSNLLIGLKKGTSILNISYQDDEKEIILPVLKKISLIYQDYSGKNKKRTQELGKLFLIEQINKFKDKSASSLKETQEFAIEQNLNYLGSIKFGMNNQNSLKKDPSNPTKTFPSFSSGVEIENIRVNAANRIKAIEYQIKRINELDLDSEQLKYIGYTIPPVNQEGLLDLLSKYESELMEKKLFILINQIKLNY